MANLKGYSISKEINSTPPRKVLRDTGNKVKKTYCRDYEEAKHVFILNEQNIEVK